MRRMIACVRQSVLAALLMAVVLFQASCAIFKTRSEVPANQAKVLLQYEWTSQDTHAKESLFSIYRGSARTGPFKQVNEKPVALSGHREGEIVTVFKDVDVRLGEEYFYYMERLDPSGAAVKIAPVAQVKAVLPLQPTDYADYYRMTERREKALRPVKVDKPKEKKAKKPSKATSTPTSRPQSRSNE